MTTMMMMMMMTVTAVDVDLVEGAVGMLSLVIRYESRETSEQSSVRMRIMMVWS
jgi:hypothetical protein